MLDPNHNRLPLRRKRLGALAVLSLCLLVLLAGFGPSSAIRGGQPTSDNPSDSSGTPPLSKQVTEIGNVIQKSSLKKLSNQTMLQGAIKGILAELDDPFSEYLPEDELTLRKRSFQGNFSGIGVQIKMDKQQIIVVTPFPGSPAFKAGVQPKDLILAINGQSTKDIALKQAVEMIVGKSGTQVALTLQREDKKVEVKVTRGRIEIPSTAGFERQGAKWRYLLNDKIGYLRITQFGGATSGDVKEVVLELKKNGLQGLILDLRFCPGGLLQSAVEISDLFLSNGLIVRVKGKGEGRKWIATKENLGDFPMVVLINGSTASAAEIVAGALRDNNRATLVGDRSFGKGSIQGLITLKDVGGALKLTTAEHFLPSGRNISREGNGTVWGVDPDDGYFVPLSEKQDKVLQEKQRQREVFTKEPKKPTSITEKSLAEDQSDPQLAAALKTLTAKLETGKFVKVGKGKEVLTARVNRMAQLKKQRERLRSELKEIEEKLSHLKD